MARTRPLPARTLAGVVLTMAVLTGCDATTDDATPPPTDQEQDVQRVTLELQLPTNIGSAGRAILLSGEGEGEPVTVLLEPGDGTSEEVVLDDVGDSATVGGVTVTHDGRSPTGLPRLRWQEDG